MNLLQKNLSLLLIVLSSSVFFSACTSTQNLPQQRPDFIENKTIAIRFNSAEPKFNRALEQLSVQGMLGAGNTAGNISLTASKNYLKIKGDSIKAYLPYFGSRQGISMRDNLGAIEFSGIPKNYSMVYDTEKRQTEISFSIDQKESNENYSVILYISNSGGSVLNINSSNRDRIAYRGKATALKTEEY
ncbi:DUF4251 domain-containing protein [Haloflavibacter putidus]|uniref:DUF4251 domain-containing protein n=1 Tax=Haloflavibacter putidus TaxID=2576776 RepID=A0A507ZR61_9FLAO|nr:DUF4251 domain-containing protein [Haloflavibacter putidus]TQD40246.1 DUF4251 domain-containing protein [Haloflavibacter putidus]